MSSVTVQLPPDTEQKLRHRAGLLGQSLETYLEKLAERDAANLNGLPGAPVKAPMLDEFTGPISQAIQAAGLSADEVDNFLEEAVQERRAERRASTGKAP